MSGRRKKKRANQPDRRRGTGQPAPAADNTVFLPMIFDLEPVQDDSAWYGQPPDAAPQPTDPAPPDEPPCP